MNKNHFHVDSTTQKIVKKYPKRAVDIMQSFDLKQVKSKDWLAFELENCFMDNFHKINSQINTIKVLGSWYGQVLYQSMSITNVPLSKYNFYDIDKTTCDIGKMYLPTAKFSNQDVTEIEFSGSDKLIINTSCEHMQPIDIKKSFVALQSNNYFEVEDHINCVNDVEELIDQYDFKQIYYKGELDFEKYKRFMVIGKLN